MRLSRIDQYIKEEPCAKQRVLLGVSSSRFSSVSRGVRYAFQIFLFTFYSMSSQGGFYGRVQYLEYHGTAVFEVPVR